MTHELFIFAYFVPDFRLWNLINVIASKFMRLVRWIIFIVWLLYTYTFIYIHVMHTSNYLVFCLGERQCIVSRNNSFESVVSPVIIFIDRDQNKMWNWKCYIPRFLYLNLIVFFFCFSKLFLFQGIRLREILKWYFIKSYSTVILFFDNIFFNFQIVITLYGQ